MLTSIIRMEERIKYILSKAILSEKEREIAKKIINNERLSFDEGVFLYEKADLHFLSLMANFVKQRISGNKVFYNKNMHIEPTNICIYNCKFCSFKYQEGENEVWDYSTDDMLEMVRKHKDSGITEIHITGGVHPHYNLETFCDLIKKIKQIMPQVHIKAFTAVEIDFMAKKSRLSIEAGLKKLKECGLQSMPGGGAEIFNEEIRKKVCDEKSSSKLWLDIHKKAHKLGIPSNATILYGHIESYADRIDHLDQIRKLQDETGGFNAFIPLKFRNINNKLSYLPEISVVEDMRNFAVTRLFLDNIPHLKAYWVMLGRKYAQMSLLYGVDDLDGTIDDSTKIYSMAGVEETNPRMTASEMKNIITNANLIPVERDSVYNELNIK